MDNLVEAILDTDTQKIAINNILNDNKVGASALSYLMATTFCADFAEDYEKVEVAGIIMRQIKEPFEYPIVTRKRPCRELAEKCLTYIGVFYVAMNEKRKRYNAPHPDWYRGVGIEAFELCKEYGISMNFNKWCDFLFEKIGSKMLEKRDPILAVAKLKERVMKYES